MNMKALKKNRGFTVVEIVVTIIIIAIMSTVAIVKWSYSTTNLESQKSLFANDLRYAQNVCIAKNDRCRFVINTGNGTYQIQNSSGTPQTLPNGGTTGTLALDISFGTFTNLINTLTFDGKGIPYTDTPSAETPLASTASIVLQTSSGQTATIQISPKTGRISASS